MLRFFLPPNYTWTGICSELRETHGDILCNYPSNLLWSIPIAGFLLLMKIYFQSKLFPAIGLFLGCPPPVSKKSWDSDLVKLYEDNITSLKKTNFSPGCLTYRCQVMNISSVAKEFSRTVPSLCNALRRYHGSLVRRSALDKFSDCAWRFVFYLSAFIYGAVILRDKPWLHDPTLVWQNFPMQAYDRSIHLYYLLELGFYISLLVTQFTDVRRKDFTQMFVHHIATIMLLTLSYCSQCVRIGSLVLVLHDCSDFFLDGAKMAKYCRWFNVSNSLLVVFVLSWFLMRLYLYPVHVLMNCAFGLYWPAWWFMYSGLSLLFVLHLIWSSLIIKSVYNIVRYGEEGQDARSDSEPDNDSPAELPEVNGNLSHQKKKSL